MSLSAFSQTVVTVNVNPDADSYVRGKSHSGENHGDATKHPIKTCGNNDYTRKAIYKFNLSAFSSATTTSATLRLKTESTGGGVTLKCYFTSDDSWTEGGVTWSNLPSTGEHLGNSNAAGGGNWTEFDITAKVKDQMDDDDVISLIVISDDCTNFFTYSKEDATVSNWPEIEIETTATAYTITSSAAGPGGTISPSGSLNVISGGNQTYLINPDAGNGYRVDDVLVDGNSEGSILVYEFTSVTDDHTIEASFEQTDKYAPIADSHVRGGDFDDYNYGDNTTLNLKFNSSSAKWARKAIVKFDLSSLEQIDEAILRIKTSERGDSRDISCYFVDDDSWTEGGVTWSNFPAEVAELASDEAAAENNWSEFDITAKVQEEMEGDDIISLILRAEEGDNYAVYSKESSNIDDWPQLVVSRIIISPPANMSANAGDGIVELDWDDNDEDDLAGYNIYRSTTSGSGYAKLNGALLGASEYTDNTVTNGTTYYYVVTAVDDVAVESDNSAEVSATPEAVDLTPPAVPANPELSVQSGNVVISWDDNSEDDLEGYHVYRSNTPAGGDTKINGSIVTNSEYTDSNVSEGTTYYYKISSVDESGNESEKTGKLLSVTPYGNYAVLIKGDTNEGTIISLLDATDMPGAPEGKDLLSKVFDIEPTGALNASELCFSVPDSEINEDMEISVVKSDDGGQNWEPVAGATMTKTGDSYKVCVPNINDFSIWGLAVSNAPSVPISNYSVILLIVLIGAALLLSKRFKFLKKAVR